MSHLSFEGIYRLAGLVAWDMGFETQDAENMSHMRTCGQCYRQFCATVQMLEALDSFGFTEAEVRRHHRKTRASRQKKLHRVEIGLSVERFYAEMEVLSAAGGWHFGAPAVMQSCGNMLLCPPARLEDTGNPENTVEVDPESRNLRIHLTPEPSGGEIRAWLQNTQGGITPIPLREGPRGLDGSMPALAAGKYRIILEK